MTATIIDGYQIANNIRTDIKIRAAQFYHRTHVDPCLAVVLTTDDPASQIYVRKKREACDEVGIKSILLEPFKDRVSKTPQAELHNCIRSLNKDDDVHGILVQVPLLASISPTSVFKSINPYKDVDVFHPENVGLLAQGTPRYLPCTPHGILQMLRHYKIDIVGKRMTIINSSNVVGKPLCSLMIHEKATVTVCHDKTPPDVLTDICQSSDIIVVAVGIPKFLKAEMIRPGAVVIDVGITRLENNKIVGDVDFDRVKEIAGYVSKVPGGVGITTVAMLLHNTLEAAEAQMAA